MNAPPLTRSQALDMMRAAERVYRQATRDFSNRSTAWERRYAGDPVTAESRKRGDRVRADLSADAAWARDEAIMYATIAQALQPDTDDDDEREWKPKTPTTPHTGYHPAGVR